MDTPEDRTHGAESAINDPLPGAEAIPADMPDSPHGDMSLEYSLQNFNALMAANTAMQGEVSNLNVIIADLRDRIEDLKSEAKFGETAYQKVSKQLADVQKIVKEADLDVEFHRNIATVVQRRLDRTLGYVDRVLDEEEGHRSPDTKTVPNDKPAVGPSIGQIPDPIRKRSTSQEYGEQDSYASLASFSPGERIDFDNGRARRY